MKTIIYTLGLALLTVTAVGETETLSSSVQKGLFEEEVNRDFTAAIEAYESAVAQFDEDRQLAATAMFRLAENYRRAERMEEAEALYERVVREFHDQKEIATAAAERLPEGTLNAVEAELVDEEAQKLEELKEIIRKSPDLLYSRGHAGNTRLHDAIEKGQLKVAEFLINQGLDLTVTNAPGLRPLHVAVREGSKAAAEFLLENGADVTARSTSTNYDRQTSLHFAAGRGFLAVAELLLEHSAEVNAADSRGLTPLHYAAFGDRIQTVRLAELLLDRGANVNAAAEDGRTALHIAAREGNVELAQLLLDRGADVNAAAADGATPLHRAIEGWNLRITELLIEHGADVNALDERGQSPLDYVPEGEGAAQLSELLREHDAREGKHYAKIVGPNEREQFVHWDRDERMTLIKALTEAGITLEDLDKVSIGIDLDSTDERDRMTRSAEIRRRIEARRTVWVDVAAILRGEIEDAELGSGALIVIPD